MNEQNQSGAGATAVDPTSAHSATPTVSAAPGETGSGWTHTQLTQAAESEVKAGRLTREQANEMLKNDGVDPLPEPKQYDTELAREIDEAFPPAKPVAYEMPPYAEHGEPFTPAMQKFDVIFRGWLSSAEFPKEIGSFVANEIHRTAKITSKLNPAQQKIWAKEQEGLLEKTFGKDLPEMRDLGRQLVAELDKKSPGFVAFLDHTRAGDSAMVVAQIALQAKRLRDKRPKEKQ